MACEVTPSIDLRIMKVMSTRVFVILTEYFHIGSRQGRVPMQVWAEKLDNEGGVEGTLAQPNEDVI